MDVSNYIIIGVSILIFICCERESTNVPEMNEALVITIGTACGWCAGTDSLLIREDSSFYERISPCDDSDYSIDISTPKDDWDEINDLLNLQEFIKIGINTCYVCADGCDTWISVRNDSISHRIRFGYQDSLAIRGIKPFVDKLESIRNRYRME